MSDGPLLLPPLLPRTARRRRRRLRGGCFHAHCCIYLRTIHLINNAGHGAAALAGGDGAGTGRGIALSKPTVHYLHYTITFETDLSDNFNFLCPKLLGQ